MRWHTFRRFLLQMTYEYAQLSPEHCRARLLGIAKQLVPSVQLREEESGNYIFMFFPVPCSSLIKKKPSHYPEMWQCFSQHRWAEVESIFFDIVWKHWSKFFLLLQPPVFLKREKLENSTIPFLSWGSSEGQSVHERVRWGPNVHHLYASPAGIPPHGVLAQHEGVSPDAYEQMLSWYVDAVQRQLICRGDRSVRMTHTASYCFENMERTHEPICGTLGITL